MAKPYGLPTGVTSYEVACTQILNFHNFAQQAKTGRFCASLMAQLRLAEDKNKDSLRVMANHLSGGNQLGQGVSCQTVSPTTDCGTKQLWQELRFTRPSDHICIGVLRQS
jgi:hypothetical protein